MFQIELIPPYSQPVDIESLSKVARGCTIEKIILGYYTFKLTLSNWLTFEFYSQIEEDYTVIFSNLLLREFRGKTISSIELKETPVETTLYIYFGDSDLVGVVTWNKYD